MCRSHCTAKGWARRTAHHRPGKVYILYAITSDHTLPPGWILRDAQLLRFGSHLWPTPAGW